MEESIADIKKIIVNSKSPLEEFQRLSRNKKQRIFFQLPERTQQSLIEDMDQTQLDQFIKTLDPDEIADVLERTDEKIYTEVLKSLDEDRKENVEFLLEFNPESAAGLMNLDYVTVQVNRSLRDVEKRVQKHKNRTGRFPVIFVKEKEKLLGELPPEVLAISDRESIIVKEHIEETPTVAYDSPDTEVIDVFKENPESSVAVLNDQGRIMGVIYAEDLLHIIEDEIGETLYEFTGVDEKESVVDGPFLKVHNRYKWLLINLGTAFLAAGAVGFFEDTIAAFTLLAVYMPVVASLGGNAGIQSMAVTVRGLTYGHISLSTGKKAILNEVIAGTINGGLIGTLVGIIALVFNQNPILGFILGVSLILNLLIAGFFGTLIPLILDRIGKDPATSATIFITTTTDVLGFFIFLGLAKTIL